MVSTPVPENDAGCGTLLFQIRQSTKQVGYEVRQIVRNGTSPFWTQADLSRIRTITRELLAESLAQRFASCHAILRRAHDG